MNGTVLLIGLVGIAIGLLLTAVGLGLRIRPSERRRRAELQQELLLADLRMRRLAQAAVLHLLQAARERG